MRVIALCLLLLGCAPKPPLDAYWSAMHEYTPEQQAQARAEFVELCKMGAVSCVLIKDYMELRLKVRECRPARY